MAAERVGVGMGGGGSHRGAHYIDLLMHWKKKKKTVFLCIYSTLSKKTKVHSLKVNFRVKIKKFWYSFCFQVGKLTRLWLQSERHSFIYILQINMRRQFNVAFIPKPFYCFEHRKRENPMHLYIFKTFSPLLPPSYPTPIHINNCICWTLINNKFSQNPKEKNMTHQ